MEYLPHPVVVVRQVVFHEREDEFLPDVQIVLVRDREAVFHTSRSVPWSGCIDSVHGNFYNFES